MFTFDYSGNTLELPNPQFGDMRRIGHNDAVVNNREGELLNIDDGQVVLDTISLSFNRLRESDKDDIKDFFETYQALPFDITDHLGREYTAIVTNVELEFVTLKDGCFYTLNLELLEL